MVFKYLDSEPYVLRAESNKRSTKQYKSLGTSNFRNRNWSRHSSRDRSRDSQDRKRKPARRSNGKNRPRNKSRDNSSETSDDRARKGRNDT